MFLSSCTHNTGEKESEDVNWFERFDFDGDGKIDTIRYSYTGGAHCCYLISLKLSSKKEIYNFPFELDGGYIVFDLSQPDKFNIQDYDHDNLPEIYLEIATYNGTSNPIPEEWQNTYGIKTNKVLIDFREGELSVIDYTL